MVRMDYKDLRRIEALRIRNAEHPEWVNSDLYRLMYSEDLYVIAYERIKSKPGNMTPGVDGSTLDGFSMEAIRSIIGKMRDESFRFAGARRVEIPKANGGVRALGIAPPKDKVVQEAIRIILEAIYEPTFSDHSHGFRPKRGCHTALQEIRNGWSGVCWIIEGDIKGCFDNIEHHAMIDVLRKRIKDERFINLIWKALKAGYFQFGTLINSVAGTPQGSIVSPILANIFLHELDSFVGRKVASLEKTNKAGRKTKTNPEHKRLSRKLAGIRKKLGVANENRKELTKELKRVQSQVVKIPAMAVDPEFIRIKYVRYADDWIIGVNGPRETAVEIRGMIESFLEETLKLTLSMEKTHIRHAKSEEAFFLGTRIKVGSMNPKVAKVTRNGRTFLKRTAGWTPIMLAPCDALVKKLHEKGFCSKEGEPTAKGAWIALDDDQIIEQYSSVLRGILNYYSFADNFSRLGRIHFILKFSAAKTLAARHRTSVAKEFKRRGKNLGAKRVTEGGGVKVVSFPKVNSWKAAPQRFNTGSQNVDTGVVPLSFRLRTRSKLGLDCAVCGETERIQMHHVRHIRKANEKLRGFNKLLATLNRKQIPLCVSCHRKVHAGKYDGIALSEFARPDIAKA